MILNFFNKYTVLQEIKNPDQKRACLIRSIERGFVINVKSNESGTSFLLFTFYKEIV